MVLRAFGAFDNEAFTVTGDSPFLPSGSPIINNSSTPIGTIFQYSDGFPVRNIVLNDTSDTPDIFNDDEEDEHVITDGKDLVANGAEVESESYHFLRPLDANGDPFGPRITVTVFSQNGQTSNIWGMSTDTPLIDGAKYVKVGGSNNGDSLYDSFIPCFTAGTLIATAQGERPVEELREGDRLVTRDNGYQELRWIGTCIVGAAAQRRDRHKRPIVIRKDALGPGQPHRDMPVSPNHRMLLTSPELGLLYSENEVFAAAKDLLKQRGIGRQKPAQVTYVHLLFDRHEAILSNGVWSESFLPGDYTLGSLEFAQHQEILSLFPELGTDAPKVDGFAPARRILKRHEVRAIGK
ncbi:Type I secretion target repeat protein [Candidatus Rhodobacter oscarellae]|uniref:Type I secretion target repeat protein n=1 Tax=Candidatus Rhodobacter oscarellae TaxID=1675527 RepID=A0A0J9E480_9RHOB|nr:Hint domain-containing protein [Candidatus Rhodobacter lobularis]KMW56634.1 Type I secretion target repeat protein [Candidatus Rhodobacter lobularis]